MLRQSATHIAPVLFCHSNPIKYIGDAGEREEKKKKKLEDMQMKRVSLTDRIGRMFGYGCRTHAPNESGIGVRQNSCLLSVLIKTAKLHLPD